MPSHQKPGTGAELANMGSSHGGRGKKIGWTIALNLGITVAEYAGGTLSGSLALVSDAGHNFADVISLVLGYVGETAGEWKSSKRHTFGFKRAEIFTALVNALLLWAVGLFIINEAINRLHAQEPISIWLMLGVAVIGLAGNVVSLLVLGRDKDASLNMKAAYAHLFYDAISSIAVIASALAIYFTNWIVLDLLVSVFIAAMIFWSGFGIVKTAVHVLMQGVPEGVEFDDVHRTILGIRGVKSVHSLHIWSINSNEAFLSCHIVVSDAALDASRTIHDIRMALEKGYGINNTTIQAERDTGCETCGKVSD